MSISSQLSLAQTTAMKSGDKETLSTLRMANSAIKTAQIDAQHELTDVEVQDILRRQVKQLNDAIKDFEAGNRMDLVDSAKKEIVVLTAYLPTQMSESDVRAKVSSIIETMRQQGDVQTGAVMSAVMKELKGLADGNLVKSIVTELLA